MNQVVPKAPTGPVAISNRWANVPRDNADLSTGVALSFPILAIGTNQWVVRWKGEDRLVTIPGTEYPAPYVDVVILKAQKEMSRVFYESGYVQGVRGKKPDCWSSDGVKPDELVVTPVNPICATCPNSAWGSGASPAAPKAQACQQRRRSVVVPYASGIDLTNEAEGGPMLLSVPPGSLTNLVRYSEMLNAMELADGSRGVPYQAVVTRLSYEPLLKFSKVQFQYLKSLDDDESDVIYGLQSAEAVGRILNSKINVDGGEVDHPGAEGGGTSQVSAPPKVAPSVPPKTQAAPAQAVPRSAAPPAPPAQTAPRATAPRVGGHPIQPATGIAEAVAKPAAPPASTRTVATAPKKVVVATDDETVDETPPVEPGSVMDKLSVMFDDLMGGE